MNILKNKTFSINDLLNEYNIINEKILNKDNLDELIKILNNELKETVIENNKELENNLLGHIKISKIIYENKMYLLENKDNIEINNLGNILKEKEKEIDNKYELIINQKNKLINYLLKDKNDLYQNFINKIIEDYNFIKNENNLIIDEILLLCKSFYIGNIILNKNLNKVFNKNVLNNIWDKLQNIKKFLLNSLNNYIDTLEIKDNEFILIELNYIFLSYNFLNSNELAFNKFKNLFDNNNYLLIYFEKNINSLNSNILIYYYLIYQFNLIENQFKNLLNGAFKNNLFNDLKWKFKKICDIYSSNFNNNSINSIINRIKEIIKKIVDKELKNDFINKLKSYETKFYFIENSINDNKEKVEEIFLEKFNISILNFLFKTIKEMFNRKNISNSIENEIIKLNCKFLNRINKVLDNLFFIKDVENWKVELKKEISNQIKNYIKSESLQLKIINLIN